MPEIRRAKTNEDVKDIAALGAAVWNEHYTPIIGKDQVDYMIDKFQSEKAISEAIQNDGYIYYGVYDGSRLAGYCGICPEEDGVVFLSKLYVDKEYRGRGISRLFLENILTELPNTERIYLTVNKNNSSSIAVYEHLGFKKVREEKTDIGGGFFMDDDIMEYEPAKKICKFEAFCGRI